MDEDPWTEYARLQSMLDRTTDAYKAAGIEAAMTDLIEKISRGEVVAKKQVNNLVVNRIGKERRRRAIVYSGRQDLVDNPDVGNQANAAESRLMLVKCEQACGLRDFELLVRQAEGRSLSEISTELDVKITTLKTRAHRARKLVLALAA